MMMQHDKREEKRCLRLPKGPNLPVLQIDAQRPALVLICTRESSRDKSRIEKNKEQRERAKIVFKVAKFLADWSVRSMLTYT